MRARKILLVDDSDEFRTTVRNTLGRAFDLVEAASEEEFQQLFRPYTFDLIVLDMRLKREREGLRLLRDILACDELQPVIMVSAYGDSDAVLDSAESGALMFLHKQDLTPELLTRMVDAVLRQAQLRRSLAAVRNRLPPSDPLVLSGNSIAIKKAAEQAHIAASHPHRPVILSGEWGSGHALVAQIIHDTSAKRRLAPFICASAFTCPSAEMQRLFFGSGAKSHERSSKSIIEQANGGLLFIDHIDKLTVDVRNRLISVLRSRMLNECSPPVPLDIQFVAGVSPDADSEMLSLLQNAGFGEQIIEITLPPLRERRTDIPLLATAYLQHSRQHNAITARTFSHQTLHALEEYTWPGNLLEMQNSVSYAAIQATLAGCEMVQPEHLPEHLLNTAQAMPLDESLNYHSHLARAELKLVEQCMANHPGEPKKEIARLLGYTDRFAFSRRIRKALQDHPDLTAEFPMVSEWFALKAVG